MQTIIARTDSYIVAVDTTRKRIYFTAIGKSVLEDPTFVRDWERAKRLVSLDFTALNDTSQLQYAQRLDRSIT